MNSDSLVKTILVLSANPKGTQPLRLAEEIREIEEGLWGVIAVRFNKYPCYFLYFRAVCHFLLVPR